MEKIVRRELKTRSKTWAKVAAQKIKKLGFTPNQISILSIVCAFVSGVFYYASGFVNEDYHWEKILFFIGGAVFIQLRLLCNMLDGMVAIEGNMKSKSGELFNDVPDRISDALILIGIGYGCKTMLFAVELGYICAIIAIMTAYVRVLGGACGVTQYFTGPLAKQHRMAFLTIGTVIGAFVGFKNMNITLYTLLIITAIGSILTVFNRLRKIYNDLERG